MAKVISLTHESQVEFRTISTFPGYRFGNDGTVWSSFVRNSGGQGKMSWKQAPDQWRLLSDHMDKRSRRRIELRGADGKRVKCFVHDLVLLAFVGPRPEGMEACHYPDRSCDNCRLDNLRWDTPKSNAHDRQLHGTQVKGSRQWLSKLNEEDIPTIRNRAQCGETYKSIAADYHVHPETVSLAVRRVTWKHVV